METPASQCSRCQVGLAESGYGTPLCGQCRGQLVRPDVPPWLMWSAVVVGALFFAAVVHLPHVIETDHALQTVRLAETRGDYASAVDHLQTVVERYPESARWTAQLGIDQYMAGDSAAANRTLDHVNLNRLDGSAREQVDQVRRASRQQILATAPVSGN